MAVDLAREVRKAIEDDFNRIGKEMEDVVPKVAKDAAKKLKSSSPKRTGKYAKGWTTKVEKSHMNISATIHGKSGTYQLAHLLEHGHANRGGGRTSGEVHIAPVEEWAVKEIETKIREAVEK